MFRNAYQSGFLSILYSCGSSPLALWDKQVKNGYIKRVTDDEVKSLALEIAGANVATTFIFCPADPKKVLGIRLPFLIMIIKNMKKYFTFEITILDDKNMHRRFRVSNFQSTTRVRPFCTTMPIGLSGGWNQIQFNLADFTRRAYGTNYVETTRMQIHANCRIRRIYFADRLYSEDEMPEEFKLFLPIHRKKCVRREKEERKHSKEIEHLVGAPPLDEPPTFHTAQREEQPAMEVAQVEEERSVPTAEVLAPEELTTPTVLDTAEGEEAEASEAEEISPEPEGEVIPEESADEEEQRPQSPPPESAAEESEKDEGASEVEPPSEEEGN